MDPIRMVWRRVDERARRYSAENAVPTIDSARQDVSAILRDLGIDPWPPSRAVEFFADGLRERSTALLLHRDVVDLVEFRHGKMKK